MNVTHSSVAPVQSSIQASMQSSRQASILLSVLPAMLIKMLTATQNTMPPAARKRRQQNAPASARYLLQPLIILLITCLGLSSAQFAYAAKKSAEPVPASVNINQADAEQLSSRLKGVGAAKARAIVKYRQQHGDFSSLEDLLAVRGIGSKLLADNKDRIKFSGK